MRRTGRLSFLTLVAGASLVLGGCTSTPPTSPETTVSSTSSRAPSAPAPSGSIPAATVPANPTAAGPAPTTSDGGSASQAPSSNAPQPTVMATSASVTLFFIAEGDAGISGPAVGCGDSAISVTSQTVTYTDPVEGALRTLLANHAAHIGQSGLRNALADARLTVDSVDRSGTTTTAHLSGTLSLAGECDIPRVEQQLLLTAQQAAGTPVAITINGKTLTEALSLK